MKRKLWLTASLAAAAVLGLNACGSGGDPLSNNDDDSGSGNGTITVGSADFPESQLVATIYAEALRAKGVDVDEKLNIGSREVYIPAIQDGSADLIPEYSGALLLYLDSSSEAKTEEEVAEELPAQLPKGLEVLPKSAAQNKDVLAVKAETAQKYDLKTFGDLKAHAGELILGGPPEWKTRFNGVLGLKDVYGLNFKSFSSLDAGGPLTLNALLAGQVQVADLFSTDPAIAENDLVVLEDDKDLFLPENVVPLVSKDKVTDEVTDTLNAVSDTLTTEDLVEMNGKVADLEDMTEIATTWLSDKDLS